MASITTGISNYLHVVDVATAAKKTGANNYTDVTISTDQILSIQMSSTDKSAAITFQALNGTATEDEIRVGLLNVRAASLEIDGLVKALQAPGKKMIELCNERLKVTGDREILLGSTTITVQD